MRASGLGWRWLGLGWRWLGLGWRCLAAIWRVLRWEPRHYWQIWVGALVTYLACVAGFTLADGWPKDRAIGVVGPASGLIGGALGMSVRLARRRRDGSPTGGTRAGRPIGQYASSVYDHRGLPPPPGGFR